MKQPNKNKRKKVIVRSKDDSRYKAYLDSLSLYNNTLEAEKLIRDNPNMHISNPISINEIPSIVKALPFSDFTTNSMDSYHFLDGDKWRSIEEFKTDKIKPISIGVYSGNLKSSYNEYDHYPKYGKPNEDVIVQKDKAIDNIKNKSFNFSTTPITTSKIEIPKKLKTIPYNITDKRFNEDGDNYTVKDSEVVKIQSRKEYRKNNLKPNSKPYDNKELGGLINTTMKKRIKKASITPKAEFGELLNVGLSGLSFIGGLMNNAKLKREQEEAERLAKVQADQNAQATDRIRLKDFKEEGLGAVNYYQEYGGNLALTHSSYRPRFKRSTDKERLEGKLDGIDTWAMSNANVKLNDEGKFMSSYEKGGNTNSPSYSSTGGKLAKLSSDMELVQGKTHAQGGVNLLNASGKPFVEVEDEETIKDGTKVYSDAIVAPGGKTYAATAEALARKKGKIETNMAKGDKITNFTNKRKLAGIDQAEDLLFEHQEASKQYGGMVKKAFLGADLNKNKDKDETPKYPEDTLLTKIAPYIDNVTNAILTATTPKIPKPILQRQVPLNTTVNVQPQLDEVSRAVGSTSNFIKNNTSDSNVARNEITSARLKGSAQKASILANKQNIEANLQNQSIMNAQQVSQQNVAKLNQTADKNLARLDDIQQRVSVNAANLSDDIISERNYKAAQRYNKERVDIAGKMYNQGTTRRSMLTNPSEIQYLLNNPQELERAYESFKGTPEEAEFRRLLGYNPKTTPINQIKSIGLANID